MALMLTRDNVLARFGGYRGGASGLIHGASSMIRGELSAPVRSGVITLTAFSFGIIQGKFHDQKGLVAYGVPVDALAGAVFHAAALFGFARNHASLLHALGDGALAAFLATTGYKIGQRWGEGTKGFLPAVRDTLHGAFVGEDKPVSGGSSITDDELKNLVRG